MERTLRIEIEGIRPALQHNGRLANPLDPFTRELASLVGQRQKTDQDLARIAHLEARARCGARGGPAVKLRDWLARQPEGPGDDAQAVARRALAELPEETLVEIIADRIEHLWRERVRMQEHVSISSLLGSLGAPPTQGPLYSSLARAASLPQIEVIAKQFPLDAPIALGDGRRVLWRYATLEDLEQREQLVLRQIRGQIHHVRLVRRAKELLRASGASCLDEIVREQTAA